MTSSARHRSIVAVIGAVAISLTFAGCSAEQDSDSTSTVSSIDPSADATVDESLPDATELPADVSAAGVVLAATLIAAGNIEDAVSSGLVTPAEVDEARAAIENGTLGEWVALAEGK